LPELPEVESIARRLRPLLVGHTIEQVNVFHPEIWQGEVGAEVLPKRAIARLRRHGKSILLELDPPMWLAIRLGMTGQCLVVARDAPRLPHTHVVMTVTDAPWELHYRDQ
jgi:formamidopyrimidine-DNA glycosylase